MDKHRSKSRTAVKKYYLLIFEGSYTYHIQQRSIYMLVYWKY